MIYIKKKKKKGEENIRRNTRERSEPILTCKNDYDEDCKYVWILCQDTRSVHRHVSSAEFLNVPSDQLVKGCAPCSGNT